MKFQVGDRVNIPALVISAQEKSRVITGTINRVLDDPGRDRYYVEVDGRGLFTLWGDQLETAVLDELARVIE